MAEEVRIDKYLWSIRVYKTRSDATDACKGGKVRVNGVDIKPSKGVKVGDVLTARKGAITYTYKVLKLIDKRQGARLVSEFAENLTPEEEIMKLRAPVETIFLKRDRGTGRPTKKDRRQLDNLLDEMSHENSNTGTGGNTFGSGYSVRVDDIPDDVKQRLNSSDFAASFGFDDDDDDDEMSASDVARRFGLKPGELDDDFTDDDFDIDSFGNDDD